MTTTVLILAAGQGTRMCSTLPKVLHRLAGKPFIRYSLDAARTISSNRPVVVIGHGADLIRAELGDEVEYVLQSPQLGTAHAVMVSEPVVGTDGQLVVVSADMPLVTAETLQKMLDVQQETGSVMTMTTICCENPRGFGRVLRDESGAPLAIIEEAQATPEQLSIKELNAAIYCFNKAWLWDALKRIQLSPKGEYYLTDLLSIAVADGKTVQVHTLADDTEAIGINTRVHLAEAERILRSRINTRWMLSGVTLIDPQTTYIEPAVEIGQDTIIYPNTHLRGNTRIGRESHIGPNSLLEDTQVGDGCTVFSSVLEGAVLENHVEIGPFGHLRKGAHLADGVHMGNFGEVKNSFLGPGTKMGHFSYIGDAQIGSNVNIGAGTITCNFDGSKKHKTEIGADVFIGSDTMLVAPVKIGEGAHTGAGAVVTHDVPAHTTVVGVPARPLVKKGQSE